MPEHLSALEIARCVRNRETSPLEVIDSVLARLEKLNPALNAFVSVRYDEALAEARAMGRRLEADDDPGILAGVPVGIKDVEDVADLPTTYGSVPFRDNLSQQDSVHVERLRAAGVIVIGKTNTPEFASTGSTKNLLFDVTRNPWDPALTPGGSSGGSAAAVVSGIVPLATGTDRGGSIRIPASYTGCFGMKPSFGRIPRGPSTMLEWSDLESIGVLCGPVEDYALYLDAVSGYHPLDPDSLPAHPPSFLACLDEPLPSLRIAWAPTFGGNRSDPKVMDSLQSAINEIEDLGHDVEEIEVELPETIAADWRAIGAFERYAELHEFIEPHRESFGRAFLAGVESGGRVTAQRYGAAQRARAEMNSRLASLFQDYNLLLTPATPTTAFDVRGRLPKEIAGVEVEDPLEVTPFTYPFNMSGHPAASVPAGLAGGLPVGLQVVGPRHRDDLVLQLCRAYEKVRPWLSLWPDL
jgi:amidase